MNQGKELQAVFVGQGTQEGREVARHPWDRYLRLEAALKVVRGGGADGNGDKPEVLEDLVWWVVGEDPLLNGPVTRELILLPKLLERVLLQTFRYFFLYEKVKTEAFFLYAE